jgi:multidrug efflux pump subunit AcrA (membrane-fusion protein)
LATQFAHCYLLEWQAASPLICSHKFAWNQIQVSDRARSQINIGQPVRVQLDAFPRQSFAGEIARISPVADAASRLIAVEVALETAEPLGSGLLARVNLNGARGSSVVVPESAVQAGDSAQEGTVFVLSEQSASEQGASEQGASEQNATASPIVDSPASSENNLENSPADGPTVEARKVKIGSASGGQVEIVSGLLRGDRYVANSDQPLSDGQAVRRALTSES